jgi:hypothetical protein
MPNFKSEITGRGTERKKNGIQRFISKDSSYKKVLSLLM